ncbi:hypothetical protein PIB30_103589 [Stylosanthes scabra]|uniref:Uncharacterized protein n=1 Tax=Stylosanthes scabra TaxID=79078 RepID=A0ABU6TXN8_9FABA|nr:hypothetical protein [Stylosanthes scabra]
MLFPGLKVSCCPLHMCSESHYIPQVLRREIHHLTPDITPECMPSSLFHFFFGQNGISIELMDEVLNLTPNLKLCLSSSTKWNLGVILQKVEQRARGWVGSVLCMGGGRGAAGYAWSVGLGGM